MGRIMQGKRVKGERIVPRSASGVFWNWRGRSEKVGATFERRQC